MINKSIEIEIEIEIEILIQTINLFAA